MNGKIKKGKKSKEESETKMDGNVFLSQHHLWGDFGFSEFNVKFCDFHTSYRITDLSTRICRFQFTCLHILSSNIDDRFQVFNISFECDNTNKIECEITLTTQKH